MVSAATRQGDMVRAQLWFDALRDAGFKLGFADFGALLNAAKEAGNLDAAEHVFQNMLDHGVQPQPSDLNVFIATAAKAQVPRGALFWVDDMQRMVPQ